MDTPQIVLKWIIGMFAVLALVLFVASYSVSAQNNGSGIQQYLFAVMLTVLAGIFAVGDGAASLPRSWPAILRVALGVIGCVMVIVVLVPLLFAAAYGFAYGQSSGLVAAASVPVALTVYVLLRGVYSVFKVRPTCRT